MFPSPSFVEHLSADLQHDLHAFLPELILCGTVVGLLLSRLFDALNRVHLVPVALIGAVWATVAAGYGWSADGPSAPEYGGTPFFSGLLVADKFGQYLRIFLPGFLALALWLSLLTGIPDREDSADYSTLLVGGTVGMMVMASANHLLTAFIAIEMASLPSYGLAGFLKGRRQGSEAALKYVVYGAAASGVMLYGISLIAAVYGTGSLPAISAAVKSAGGNLPLTATVGAGCVLAGLGFKLAAVPFHFWCPDVFEGAAAEVGAFLSVASKAAALALTARFLFVFGSATDDGRGATTPNALGIAFAVVAAITATFGNIAALGQTNIKRLLAYSTIAHAGIMMMALSPTGPRAVGPILFYISSYLLMNLGAYAVVALVRNRTGSEDLSAYRGLLRRSPVLGVGMALFLLSLLGMPPLAGFAAKFQVFAVLYETGRTFGNGGDALFGWFYFALLTVAGLNTALSAGYYLRVVRAIVLDAPEEDAPPLSTAVGGRIFMTVLAGMVVAVGIFWNPLTKAGSQGAKAFQKSPRHPRIDSFLGVGNGREDAFKRD